ncbi:MAG: YtxH domain-containing protein [Anaerolineales bacterium]
MSDSDNFGMFLVGFVVGGVAGAVAALLLAPQSGEETRTLIKDKSIELRDMAAEQADVFATRAGEVTTEARTRGKKLVDSAKEAVARKKPAAEPPAEPAA